jgi:general secretion pathway protein G
MKRTDNSRKRARSAFTMMEMVLVLAIIALLMGVAIKGTTGFLDRGKRTRALADIQTIANALVLYQSDNLRLPTTEQGIKALYEKPTTAPVPRNWMKYLRKEILDPWGSPFQYRIPPQKNTDGDYDLFSMGKDGVADTEDDIGNWMDL